MAMKRTAILALVALVFLLSGRSSEAQTAYQVVVHASNEVSSLTKADLSRIFLKKKREWDSGLKTVPVDQAPGRTVRETFTRDVHGKAVTAIKSYWQRLIFTGRDTPPVELATDSEVLDYVRRNSGGIGYISSGTAVGSGLKVIRISS